MKNKDSEGRGYNHVIEEAEERKKNLCVREPAANYNVMEPEKEQGEYTLEDYLALPEDRRVELIDGVFYDMASPSGIHQRILGKVYSALEVYVERKKGMCEVFPAPFDVQLDCNDKTIVQPDILVVCDREKILAPGLYGAPDLVIEILSLSTKKKDMTLKLRKYKNAGVREYWMIDPDKRTVVVYEFGKENNPTIYGFDAKVPVGIFGGECRIDFAEIYERIKYLYEK